MSSTATSSSEDDSGRRGIGPNPPSHARFPNKPQAKKKKKPLPPQETIDKIWSQFSVSKFSKATVILPFATPNKISSRKPTDPPIPVPQNLLVSEDFERAVRECRAKVQKLVKECRRVNMRYRDPDFDIDWDLKWRKGHCLNGLVESKFELNGQGFGVPTSMFPKAVKRVHEIFDKPTFLKGKVDPADVRQGFIGNCWLMASLTALANMDVGLQRICVEYDTQIGIYGFVFHRGSQALFFAHCKDANETWLPLLEKAYAKAHGDYAALSGGWIGEGVEDLTGGVTTELLTSDILDTDEFWSKEIMKVNKEFLFGCSTGNLGGGYGQRDGISEGHAYVIMEARELTTGERLLKLRNPWGKGKKGNWEGAWSDGSKEFTPEAQIELNHKFGNDSVFWISYLDLLRKYQHFDRTRLFMDSPDWRLTQKWISVEVPWKAEFAQKFRIVLKKESPVVLVLSQLDDRYFEGLQGQYRFRLQFRLHEVNSPGDDEYIVRSHGNYLMERSVVTELKSIKAGTYSVFVMVAADRDIDAQSVEDVVKLQCRQKIGNEKLAQVGAAYDLAHSKGAVHMKSRVEARKLLDKAKARETRIATRRKLWELRQLSRDIGRKQDKKNREKREKKEAKDAAEAKEKQEKEPKDRGVQTEDPKEITLKGEDKGVQTEEPAKDVTTEILNENDKGVQTEAMSITTTRSTPETISMSSSPGLHTMAGISFPPRSNHNQYRGPPTPPPRLRGRHLTSVSGPRGNANYLHGRPRYPHPQPDSEGESSASPVSDYDNMYSDDNPSLDPRVRESNGATILGAVAGARKKESGDEDESESWNAICIVGFRVYSQDADLSVSICEGDEEDIVEPKLGEKEVEMEKMDEEGTDGDVEDEGEKKKDILPSAKPTIATTDESSNSASASDNPPQPSTQYLDTQSIDSTPLKIPVKLPIRTHDEDKKPLALDINAPAKKQSGNSIGSAVSEDTVLVTPMST
ncbi:hypothetical protein B7494_g3942 [Chlorociboria aeruginascens]|nr:hypothetical protein B7494_g3942 [Chlorociboria aeruginascens]